MEKYTERLVKGRVGNDAFLMMGGGVVLIIGGIVMTILLSTFGLFIVAVGIFVIVQATSRFHIEFEYLIMNGDVDIAKIISKKSRKDLCSIKEGDITSMASLNNDRARNDLEVKKQLKILDYTEKKPDADNYYVIFENKNGKEAAYILDLDEKSVEIMKDALKMKFRK